MSAMKNEKVKRIRGEHFSLYIGKNKAKIMKVRHGLILGISM